jgi:hypothetical protein
MAFANMSSALSHAPFPFPGGRLMPTDIVWSPARIREKILSSDVMLERSIVKIFEHQTREEQNANVTVEHNKVGFTAFDAEILSSYAHRIQSNTRQRQGERLTVPMRIIARRRMVKYAKQLAKIIDHESVERGCATQAPCEECNATGRVIYDDVGEGPIACRSCNGRGYRL